MADTTQLAVADALGVTDRAVWNWANRVNTPPAWILGRLAQHLNVSSDYLLGLSEDGGP